MLKGTGFTDEDLAKPIVGVGTTWIETMPCNLNQRDLRRHVKRGVRDAGGTPMEFNTIAVSDGVSMGTSGMRASLVSREVIADSIDSSPAATCSTGSSSSSPATRRIRRRDGRRAARHPRGRLLHGLDRPGRLPAARRLDRGRLRGDRRPRGRKLERRRAPPARVGRVPGGRRVRRAVHGQHDVHDPRLPRALALRHERHPGDARRQGGGRVRDRPARQLQLVRENVTPRSFVTKESFENAVASVAATGGSTNAVLHVVAIARDFRIDFTIDDFERISARTPIVADMKPWGRWHANDMYAAGGVAVVARELKKAGLLHEGTERRRWKDAQRARGRRGGDRGPERDLPDRDAAQGARRRRGALRQPRPRGLRGQAGRATTAPCTAAPRACSTPRRRASPRSRRAGSPRATSW